MSIKYFNIGLFLGVCLALSPCYGDWESEANARIEQIRKRDAEITVVDSNGYPVPGINVQIEQIGHHFAFGTCISYWPLVIYSNYRNFILDHFEWAVCENETKWPSNEGTQDSEDYSYADNIYQWSNSNGLKMRGHCLFWEQWNQVQSWVQSLSYATYPTSSDLLTEVDERIDSAVNHYKNKFHNWDVDNEMLPTGSGNEFYNRLGEGGRVHMFEQAKSVDPNCGMFMNEYTGNSFGGYDSGPYVSRASSLISMGAPIDGLGIQGHLGADLVFEPQRYYDDVLEPLATLDLPIWATEFDASHSDENISADNIENYFRICFSHPSVEGIIMWGFWQNSMWRENAYLVDSSWNLTERGLRYEALMDEWTTTDSNTTDGSGKVAFRGFHGTYRITLSAPSQPTEIYTIELEPGETTARFVLERYISDVGILGSWVSGTTHAKESGTDRALIFIAHAEDNEDPSITLNSVSYGGQPMTKVVENVIGTTDDSRVYVAAFILNEAGVAAASGSTFSVSWNQASVDGTGYGSVFLQNVNQSELTGATARDGTPTGALITTPWLATNPGDMVIGAATCSSTGSYTMNNAFTEALELTITSADAVEGYKTATGAEEIPSVTHSTTSSRQSLIGFVVQAPPVFSDCDYVQNADFGLLSDLNGDCYVDLKDLGVVAQYWLNTDCASQDDCEGADFEPSDGDVDFFDLGNFVMQWLWCNDPEDPGCTPNW